MIYLFQMAGTQGRKNSFGRIPLSIHLGCGKEALCDTHAKGSSAQTPVSQKSPLFLSFLFLSSSGFALGRVCSQDKTQPLAVELWALCSALSLDGEGRSGTIKGFAFCF